MDFLRSDTHHEPIVEEPEYSARFTAIKHSWRGRYRRIFCISQAALITLEPSTLAVTNQWDLAADFESASPGPGGSGGTTGGGTNAAVSSVWGKVAGSGAVVGGGGGGTGGGGGGGGTVMDGDQLEFSINVRSDGRGKFKAMRFSCRYRVSLLTELFRAASALKAERSIFTPLPIHDFSALHLRRRSGDWTPYTLRITVIGLEVRDCKTGDLHWCLDFRDMAVPGVVLLRDSYGGRGADGAGFILCPCYGGKRKVYMAGPGTTNTAIVTKMVNVSKTFLGHTLVVDNGLNTDVRKFIEEQALLAVGPEEMPVGEWSVVRLRTAGHGTASSINAPLGQAGLGGLGGTGGIGTSGDAVSRRLVVTHTSIVERRPNNYEAVLIRPLSAVFALVRFAEEPQMFAIEFNDGSPTLVYTSTSRDALLAATLDTVQNEGQRPVPVNPRPTLPGHHLDPPCTGVPPAPPPVPQHGPGRLFADLEGEMLHLKHLAAASRDAVADGGSIPGSKARLWRRVREFNACVPYFGVLPNAEVPEVALMALLSMLPPPPPAEMPANAPPLPPPSQKAGAALMGLLACLRRLLGASSAVSMVLNMPGALLRVLGLLRSGSEGVAAEAARLVAFLIGGGSGEAGLVNLKGERHALLVQAKFATFANVSRVGVLINRLRPLSISPLLSMAVVEVLEAMLCEPLSETTDDRTFCETLRQVASLRRRLFSLFAHPSPGVIETVGVIMKTIAEEDAVAAEPMRDAALRDGAVLRHLIHAFFLPEGERRDVSRQLVALWADGYPSAMDLLARTIPPGLVAYLRARAPAVAAAEETVGPLPVPVGGNGATGGSATQNTPAHHDSADAMMQRRKQKRLLQTRRGRGIRARLAAKVLNAGGTAGLVPEAYGGVLSGAGGVFESGHGGGGGMGDGFGGGGFVGLLASSGMGNSIFNAVAGVNNNRGPMGEYGGVEVGGDVAHGDGGMEGTGIGGGNRPVAHGDGSADGAWGQTAVPGASPAVNEGGVASIASTRLRCNWSDFWHQFSQDHHRADLIWNEQTRQELKEALEKEVHHLDLQRERSADGGVPVVVPLTPAKEGETTETATAIEERTGHLSWNYAEFKVKYATLSRELCVGQYYLRLLLESGGPTSDGVDSDVVEGAPKNQLVLRDPPTFFRALYHRFLCDADAGLFVEGVNIDESEAIAGSPTDWCSMSGLEGFGGFSAVNTRELCARAMTIVYDQFSQVIGPFDGTAHITVLLDRTNDRALRHRLLLLLKSLVKVPANAEACVAVGGCELAVDLLTTAHEMSERAAIPLQSNLIAATAHCDPPKEWFYSTAKGEQIGPMEKDRLRRVFSKGEVDWNTKCWAAGMTEWKPLRNIRELRWALGHRTAVLTPVKVGEVALSILQSLVSVQSSLDSAGELVSPTPIVKRILSSPRCFPHIAQALLTGEPAIVEGTASLLEAICTHNPAALARLYSTGAFYFCLAYAGSNLQSVAKLFKMAHCHQAFHDGLDATVSSSLPLAKRSVLGGLLPASLLYVLETGGQVKFAAAMAADSDNPEIIWTHKMRANRLIDQVLKHLGDFPQKLAQHCHSLYDYAPMPPVTYPELKDEMWCHRYYLRNLCDQISFPRWEIVEHVEFLQSLLAMWHEELTRRPMELSEEAACEILEIPEEAIAKGDGGSGRGGSPGGAGAGAIVVAGFGREGFGGIGFSSSSKKSLASRIDEEVLKRQYKKLAMRYHPDKNPDGREKFMAIQAAYETLQASLQGLQGPQPWRLRLLLKGQCILYSRHGDVLGPFKYAGYPMLLEAIAVDEDDNTFLSSDRAPLLEAATELAWLTCLSSAPNGAELVRDGGVPLLANLLSRCMYVVQPNTAPTESAAVIVTNVMRTFAAITVFENARSEIINCPGFILDVVHCCELERATVAVDAALQTVSQLSIVPELQDKMLKAGIIWYLLPLLLQYDATASKEEGSGPDGVGQSVQKAKNIHAMLAGRGLGRLSGLLTGELATPVQPDSAAALRALLTPRLASMLRDKSPKELLRNLTSNLETPQIIWNNSTRAELLTFIEDQRASGAVDGIYSLEAAKGFRFETLSRELHVGNVYLRVYNNQPDFELSGPEEFCESLLNFIRENVDARRLILDARKANAAEEVLTDNKENGGNANEAALGDDPYITRREEIEVPEMEGSEEDDGEGEEKTGGVVKEGGVCGELEPDTAIGADKESDVEVEEVLMETCVARLIMALTALQNILAKNPQLATIFCTRQQMEPLLGCLTDTSAESREVPELALSVLGRLTANAASVEAMVADKNAVLLLIQLLHSAPTCRQGTLRVLYALASTPELAWAAAKHGGTLYVLEQLLPAHEDILPSQRAAAASLLGKLVAQPMHGPRVAITLGRFLPDGLVAAVRDGPGEAVVAALNQTTETPELVWSPAMAGSLGAQVATMAEDLYREQTQGRVEWEVPDAMYQGRCHGMGGDGSPSGHIGSGLRDEPQVGGVYVRLFLKDPKFPLRNPKRFLEGMLDQYITAAAATHFLGGDSELPLLLSAALVSLLRVQPQLADHVAHLGYISKLVGAMAAEGGRARMAEDGGAEEKAAASSEGGDGDVETVDADEGSLDSPVMPTPQERVRGSCLRILHQLATSTACAESMATPNAGAPQVVPLLMRAIGWPGMSVLALETLKRVVVAGNRARDALVAQALRVGLIQVLLALLDWRGSGKTNLGMQMKWNESEAAVGRVLAIEVLKLLGVDGAHSAKVQEVLDSSEIWRAYKDQKHDLFLPSNAGASAAGVAGLIKGGPSSIAYALPAPPAWSVASQPGNRSSSTMMALPPPISATNSFSSSRPPSLNARSAYKPPPAEGSPRPDAAPGMRRLV